jgi:putative transposase
MNPIEAYVQEKFTQAKKTRKAATDLARTKQSLASASTVRTPLGPSRPAESETAVTARTQSSTQSQTDGLASLPPPTPVRPRKLSIGTGQVF